MKETSFGKYTSVIYRYTQIIVNHRIKSYGLGSGQYLFLIHIHKKEGISQKELTCQLNVDKATTAKALNKLEELDYIRKVKDQEDRRYHHIYLTDKGKAFMPILKEHLNYVTTILSKGMSEEDIDYTKKIFDLMIENAISAVQDLKEE